MKTIYTNKDLLFIQSRNDKYYLFNTLTGRSRELNETTFRMHLMVIDLFDIVDEWKNEGGSSNG